MKNFLKIGLTILAGIVAFVMVLTMAIGLADTRNAEIKQTKMEEEISLLKEKNDNLQDEVKDLIIHIREEEAKLEDDNIWDKINYFYNSREAILEELLSKDSMDDKIFNEILKLQNQAISFYNEVADHSTNDSALIYEIESKYFYPISSGFASQLSIPDGTYQKAIWADNVSIPENNANFKELRIYTLIDDNKEGYVIIEGVETGMQLIEISPVKP